MASKMSTTQRMNSTEDRCAKCFAVARHGYSLMPCNRCSKLFHSKNLFKMSAGNGEFIVLCLGCKQKRVSVREKESTARYSSAASKTIMRQSTITITHALLATKDEDRVADVQASPKISTSARRVSGVKAPSKTSISTHSVNITPGCLAASSNVASNTLLDKSAHRTNSTFSHVSNTGILPSDHVELSNNNNSNNRSKNCDIKNSINNYGSSFVLLDSFKAILDARLNKFLSELAISPAGKVSSPSDLEIKIASLESTIKHQEILLGNITLELHELARTNDELAKELVRLRSRETYSEVTNTNFTGEPGDNSSLSPLLSVNLPSLPHLPSLSQPPSLSPPPFPLTGRSEVVNDGELIITNFIEGSVDNYSVVAHAVLATLDPSV